MKAEAVLAFQKQVASTIRDQGRDSELVALSRQWMQQSCSHQYTYHFSWLGRPVIQFPQDLMAIQEIIWRCQPDLIIETGIAHGGSLIFHASLLQLLGGRRLTLGIDIDIRPHNREAIESHPLASNIRMLQGSSVAPDIVDRVYEIAAEFENPLLILDSNHTHQHVLEELRLYTPLVKNGSYAIVFDTSIDDAPAELFADRPWGPGNNPKTAVREFLRGESRFSIDQEMQDKLLITVAIDGYLRCDADLKAA